MATFKIVVWCGSESDPNERDWHPIRFVPVVEIANECELTDLLEELTKDFEQVPVLIRVPA